MKIFRVVLGTLQLSATEFFNLSRIEAMEISPYEEFDGNKFQEQVWDWLKKAFRNEPGVAYAKTHFKCVLEGKKQKAKSKREVDYSLFIKSHQ